MEVKAGYGLLGTETFSYYSGGSIQILEIGLDINSTIIDPKMIAAHMGLPGQVLGIDDWGKACWQDPFNSDKELREKYPPLEESWGTLLEALKEYELVKKLVQDHDK